MSAGSPSCGLQNASRISISPSIASGAAAAGSRMSDLHFGHATVFPAALSAAVIEAEQEGQATRSGIMFPSREMT